MVHFHVAQQNAHHRRFAIPLHLLNDDPDNETEVEFQRRAAVAVQQAEMDFRKRQSRLTPDEIAAMQSSLSASAARAQTQTQAQQTATRGGGANPATAGTSVAADPTTRSAAPTYSLGEPLVQTPSSRSTARSSSSAVTSSVTSSSARVTSSSRSVAPSSSTTASSPSSSSSQGVRTITQSTTASASSATPVNAPTNTAEAADQGSSTGLGTGAVVGIVLAVLIGVVILGSAFGWLYRKFASRGYKDNSRWRKLDEDITPFPSSGAAGVEKYADRDDIYGGAAIPVIGSNRALAHSTQRDTYGPFAHGHANGNNMARPMTEYDMYQRNRAGVGSGMDGYPTSNSGHGHGEYDAYGQPMPHSPYAASGPGRPAYSPQPHSPAYPYPSAQDYGYPDEKHSPPGSRQLVGGAPYGEYGHPYAHAQPAPELQPVPLGRPAAPVSYDDIAHREDYADEPPSADYPPHAFSTQAPVGVQLYDRPAGSTPTAPVAPPAPLPTLRPISSFASSFNFDRPTQAPPSVNSHEGADEQLRQKQLYGEVSRAAGFPEPKTPHSASVDSHANRSSMLGDGDRSFGSSGATANMTVDTTMTMDQSMISTDTSFSVPERLPQAQRVAPRVNTNPLPMPAPGPYEHGRPLSPLVEVATPSTSFSVQPIGAGAPLASMASSSVGHAREVNPFDHLQPNQPGNGRMLVAPSSAGASAGSIRYPPPSPSGMSVPGSVSGSPLPGNGRKSMYDEEDAYGGI